MGGLFSCVCAQKTHGLILVGLDAAGKVWRDVQTHIRTLLCVCVDVRGFGFTAGCSITSRVPTARQCRCLMTCTINSIMSTHNFAGTDSVSIRCVSPVLTGHASEQTTWLYRLQTGEHRRTNPTIVSNYEEIIYKNVKLFVWDLGGMSTTSSAADAIQLPLR